MGRGRAGSMCWEAYKIRRANAVNERTGRGQRAESGLEDVLGGDSVKNAI